ncbi:alpha/beta hydrolase [Deinococcus irradiatisoli]|uniref:Alpha/beta hydrolase n=1 Tax=Deinococcus irradiatisoli TaxID=2202254 RepID=A0A2Z3JII8_9DEIO|nr:alpha/beta fold hydrolase [Deinococcus irradiatisoli]AWN22779.1 alpha/beta hydrolase [Deinococcus irradiatisoli]
MPVNRSLLLALSLSLPLPLVACAPAASPPSVIGPMESVSLNNAVTVPAQGERRATLIVYSGGKVKPEAYRYLGEALAPSGIQTVILGFPQDLAIFAPNRADEVLARLPAGEKVYLAGHSLGGVTAAQYLEQHRGRVAGLILLGSYPAENVSLRGQPLRVLDLLAENDGLSTPDKVEAGLARLPESTQLVRLPGAVHAFFGRYGEQAGDGTPTATREATEARIVDAVRAFILP